MARAGNSDTLPKRANNFKKQLKNPAYGRAKGDGPKVTEPNLQFPAVFCENLRFPAKICGFSAVSCPLQMLEFSGEGVHLRKSAVFCGNLIRLPLSP